MKFIKGMMGAVIGATPGLILVLLAFFVIKGEWQLTIAAMGLMTLGAGTIAGFAVGWSRSAAGPQLNPSRPARSRLGRRD